MKKLVVLLIVVCLVGCGQDRLTFKSNEYGEKSKVVVYFEEDKATKAYSETTFETEKEAKQEYDLLKNNEIYLNVNLDNKTVSYEQIKYIEGMSKEAVKKIFKESSK